jgi:hypothetical protein
MPARDLRVPRPRRHVVQAMVRGAGPWRRPRRSAR